MKLLDLIALLETLNLPIAEHHFKVPQTPPFLIYLEADPELFNADNMVYHEVKVFDIELYNDIRDHALEKRIKDLLNGAKVLNDFSAIFIDATKQWKTTYEVSINGE